MKNAERKQQNVITEHEPQPSVSGSSMPEYRGPIRPPLRAQAGAALTGQPVQDQEGQPTSRPGLAPRGEPRRADSDREPKAAAAPLASQSRPAVESQRRRKRQQLPPLPVHLTRPTARFASRLRKERGPIDRPTAERLARFMVAILTPRKPGGSQATDAVLTAVKMRQQGKKWPEIYPVAIFGFANMPFDERSYRKFRLRRATSAYGRRRRKKESARSPHQPNHAVRVVSRPADLTHTDNRYGTAESSQDLGPDRAHAPEGGQVPAQRGSG